MADDDSHSFSTGPAARSRIDQLHAKAVDKLRTHGLKGGFMVFYRDEEGHLCVLGHAGPRATPSTITEWALTIAHHAAKMEENAEALLWARLIELAEEYAEDEGEPDGS